MATAPTTRITELRSAGRTSSRWNPSRKLPSVGRDGRACSVGDPLNGANTSHSIGRAKNIATSAAKPANATRDANAFGFIGGGGRRGGGKGRLSRWGVRG